MMDWTDRHDRYFLRLISARALLYTEMVTTGAIIHGDRKHLLSFNETEHPVALQIGGSEPADLAEASRIATDFGYDEINLNVGCPSDRVQSGRFGACLMEDPGLVARCYKAIAGATHLPVTIKSRIGIDDQDPEVVLPDFIRTVADAGCTSFTLHARKAILDGLSPKENRQIPPLNYPLVYCMKEEFPDIEIVLNGGVTSVEEVKGHLNQVDGVMVGRAAYQNPWLLAGVDSEIFGDLSRNITRHQTVEAMVPYAERHCANGGNLHHISRHMTGLFQGQPGAKAWRQYLSEQGSKPGAGAEVLSDALKLVPGERTSLA